MKRVFFLHRSNLHSFRSNLMQRAKKIRSITTPDFFCSLPRSWGEYPLVLSVYEKAWPARAYPFLLSVNGW